MDSEFRSAKIEERSDRATAYNKGELIAIVTLTSPQFALSLHTSSPELGLAIADASGQTRCQTWDLGRDLSVRLHSQLVEFIRPQTWQDLQYLVVAKGPGSFTGTRIGVVTARTLAQQLDIPLFAVSTLEAIAWDLLTPKSGLDSSESEHGAIATHPPKRIAVQMRAQRGQLYVALFLPPASPDLGLSAELPDTVMSPQEWDRYLDRLPHPYRRAIAPDALGSTASAMLGIARQQWLAGKRPHWSAALPFYGQHPVD
ncbi:tRNA (adenosine(37)-N6)-threonylcarbamoyltransferase complex dimerization subunit type 1 TsaB [Oxynema sp. CENA135]|uniref:tRNA (adenosine(37)-N6)-threonylcarbamoyltransferase complex dimerization subunit type 1 TsaB n=1 Tax=Oxynema sp. CENA135 TaxID=984206 RepID=UPI00190A9BAA|nr:tRNA (adenosine(37)-N6)-threonylcarbamoyltransferase complex dimerization subunit type 1 TsaB [Oxynema sp. CENA135]MBK4729631.1 tRNA (adenosine(37)-N6)-threonylcarbamoyltransferase complex dimerization subunit type 1 TsaB [Oxynema sp. CENA135]